MEDSGSCGVVVVVVVVINDVCIWRGAKLKGKKFAAADVGGPKVDGANRSLMA